MIISLLVSIVANPFNFGGGDDTALAQKMSDWSGQSVVVLADARRKWPKTSVEDRNEGRKAMAKYVQGKLGTTLLNPEESMGFSAKAWSELLYRTPARAGYESGFKKTETSTPKVKDGLISFTTKMAPVKLTQAYPEDAKHHWAWHWFFDEMRIAVASKNLTERQYADAVAAAIGAKVIEKKDEYYFDIDPKAYRARSIALADERFSNLRSVTGEKYDYLLLSKGLMILSDSQIEQLLSKPGGNARLENITSQQVLQTISTRLQMQYPVNPKDGIVRNPTAKTVWEEIRDAIDWNRNPSLIFYADGMVACHYPGSKKMPGGVVL